MPGLPNEPNPRACRSGRLRPDGQTNMETDNLRKRTQFLWPTIYGGLLSAKKQEDRVTKTIEEHAQTNPIGPGPSGSLVGRVPRSEAPRNPAGRQAMNQRLPRKRTHCVDTSPLDRHPLRARATAVRPRRLASRSRRGWPCVTPERSQTNPIPGRRSGSLEPDTERMRIENMQERTHYPSVGQAPLWVLDGRAAKDPQMRTNEPNPNVCAADVPIGRAALKRTQCPFPRVGAGLASAPERVTLRQPTRRRYRKRNKDLW